MKISHWLYVAALIVTAGCDGNGVVRLPPTDIKVFHAASDLSPISFNREAIQLGIMAYGEGVTASFDSGPYDFFILHQPVGSNDLAELISLSENLSANLDYTFILITQNGQPEMFVVTTDSVPLSETTTRITIAHAFEGLGDLDVYLEPPGTVLSTALPRTTISFATNPSPFEVSPGTLHIFLTTAGDPNDVVFESAPQGISVAQDRVYVVSDPGALGTSNIQLSGVSANTGRIGQIGEESRIRVVQGIDDRMDRDIYLDDTLSPPLFPAQPFGVFSNYENAAISLHPVITTMVGVPGTEEDSTEFFARPGRLFTALIAGDSVDGVVARIVEEDKRSIVGQASLRVFNGAGLFETLDVYIELPGTDILTETPLVFFSSIDATDRIRIPPDDYEITVVDFATSAVVAGPQVVTMDDGGVYGVLLLNSATGSTVDIQLFEDFLVP